MRGGVTNGWVIRGVLNRVKNSCFVSIIEIDDKLLDGIYHLLPIVTIKLRQPISIEVNREFNKYMQILMDICRNWGCYGCSK